MLKRKLHTGAAPNVSYDATIAMVGSWFASPSTFNPGNHPFTHSQEWFKSDKESRKICILIIYLKPRRERFSKS